MKSANSTTSSPDIPWIPRHLCEDRTAHALRIGGVENYRQEAVWMIEELSRRHRPDLLPSWIARRIAGEPFQYILGSTDFYCLELEVGPGVLIPRPETEILVEKSLEFYRAFAAASSRNAMPPPSVCDLCTGSGAIALCLAHELPDTQVTGVDLSPEALKWAEKNRRKHHLDNANFLEGDLFSPLDGCLGAFAMITANPPYVSEEEYQTLPAVVKDFEPRLALLADDNGLALIERIAQNAPRFLLPGGGLIMEIGSEQGQAAAAILEEAGFTSIEIFKDFAQLDRICFGTMNRRGLESKISR